jgi:TetR/AcrR family transcriptional regulator, mexJK operon transcriptional repressor
VAKTSSVAATQAKRKDRTRKKIENAALVLFLKSGFASTSMDDVATAAEVSKQTVYSHFESKEALFLEIMLALMLPAGDQVQSLSPEPSGASMNDFLLAFALQQLAVVLSPNLMQLRRLVIGEAQRFPQLGKTLHKAGPLRSINRLTQAFDHYKNAGSFKGKDTRSAAEFFNWILMGGPVNAAMLLGDTAIPKLPQLRKHAQESVRIFLAAYG